MIVIQKDGKPFKGTSNLDLGKIEQLVRESIWTDKDLAVYGLSAVEIADPVPEPAPIPTETSSAEKLAALLGEYGLTIEDLKKVLQ